MKPGNVKKTNWWRNRYCVINRLIVLLVASLLEHKDIVSPDTQEQTVLSCSVFCDVCCGLVAGFDHWLVGDSLHGGHEDGVWRRPSTHSQRTSQAGELSLISFCHTESFSKLYLWKESMILMFSLSSEAFELWLNTRTETALKYDRKDLHWASQARHSTVDPYRIWVFR